MRTICRTLALHPQIWGHRIEPFALPSELQAHLISVVNDPENIDIIAMFDVFVKAFFSIPAQI